MARAGRRRAAYARAWSWRHGVALMGVRRSAESSTMTTSSTASAALRSDAQDLATDRESRGPRGRRLPVRERLRRRERLGPAARPARALVPSPRGARVRERGLRRQPAALLAGVERGGRWTSRSVPQLAADALADGAAAGAARRGAPLDEVPERSAGLVAQAADLVPLLQDVSASRAAERDEFFWRAPERGRADRALRRAVPARARLAAGTDRREVAAHRRGGVPGAAAHAGELPPRDRGQAPGRGRRRRARAGQGIRGGARACRAT